MKGVVSIAPQATALSVRHVLSRDAAANQLVATLTIANTGTSTAVDVRLIGAVWVLLLPVRLCQLWAASHLATRPRLLSGSQVPRERREQQPSFAWMVRIREEHSAAASG